MSHNVEQVERQILATQVAVLDVLSNKAMDALSLHETLVSVLVDHQLPKPIRSADDSRAKVCLAVLRLRKEMETAESFRHRSNIRNLKVQFLKPALLGARPWTSLVVILAMAMTNRYFRRGLIEDHGIDTHGRRGTIKLRKRNVSAMETSKGTLRPLEPQFHNFEQSSGKLMTW